MNTFSDKTRTGLQVRGYKIIEYKDIQILNDVAKIELKFSLPNLFIIYYRRRCKMPDGFFVRATKQCGTSLHRPLVPHTNEEHRLCFRFVVGFGFYVFGF